MRLIIDRFEGEYVMCEKENREIISVKRSKLPAGVREGDVLRLDGEYIKLDAAETKARKRTIEKLAEELWE